MLSLGLGQTAVGKGFLEGGGSKFPGQPRERMSVCRAEDGEHLITWVTRVSSSECFSHGVRCTQVYTCTHAPVPILPLLPPLSGLLALEEITDVCMGGWMDGWN